jgi:integrase
MVSFFCLLGHRHRLRALDEAGNPVTDRKGAERAYYRAVGGPCPVEERRRRREQVEAEQAEAAQRVLELKRFETVATEYLTWAGQSRPRSLMFREKALKHLETAFKGRVLGAIEEQDVEAYVVRRKDAGAAPGTVNRERAVLSHLFTKAIAWKYVSRNPVKGTEPLKEPNEKPRPLSFDEEAALFKVLPAHYKPFVTLALHTGLRLGELRHQVWRDIDLPGAVLRVTRPKSGQTETIPLNTTARSLLKELERTVPVVFPRLPGKLTDLFKRYVAKANLPADITFHCLRDTYISRLAEHVSTPTLMALARHRDYKTTRRYVKVDGDHLRAAVEALANGSAGGNKVAEVDQVISEILDNKGK